MSLRTHQSYKNVTNHESYGVWLFVLTYILWKRFNHYFNLTLKWLMILDFLFKITKFDNGCSLEYTCLLINKIETRQQNLASKTKSFQIESKLDYLIIIFQFVKPFMKMIFFQFIMVRYHCLISITILHYLIVCQLSCIIQQINWIQNTMNHPTQQLKSERESIDQQFIRYEQQHKDSSLIYIIIFLSIITWISISLFINQEQSTNNVSYHDLKSPDIFKRLKAEHNFSLIDSRLSSEVKQRVSYGQARPIKNFMKVVVVSEVIGGQNQNNDLCILTNGINIVSNKTFQTSKSFLDQQQVTKWIVLLPAVDSVSDQLFKQWDKAFPKKYKIENFAVETYSDYSFITQHTNLCKSLLYLQNNFVIDPQNAQKFIKQANVLANERKEMFMGYTVERKTLENKTIPLQELQTLDFNRTKQQVLNQYVYIFSSGLLEIVGPLNFAHFNKYTIENMFIFPTLALMQKTNNLVAFKGPQYAFDEAVVQFKEFALKKPVLERNISSNSNSFCFVSYPLESNRVNPEQFVKYARSITQIKADNMKITVVPYFPYIYRNNESFVPVLRAMVNLKSSLLNSNVRIRIKQNKVSSSLALYELVHNYCPTGSMVIASRFNIAFSPDFLQRVKSALTEKSHYYHAGRLSQNVHNIRKTIKSSDLLRLSQVQIFKSNLMRMINLWALKSDENEFFQSEGSFLFPFIEMLGHKIQSIPSAKYELISQRQLTSRELEQLDMLKRYAQWDKISDGLLTPIMYNSLTNLDLRKGALDLIPKNIHQVWLKETPPPESFEKLQKSIKEVNKDFKYTFWNLDRLNPNDFPLCYHLVARILDYQSTSTRSFHPWIQALMSYEILYNEGGIYLSMRAEGRKSLSPFLKYELFFAGFYNPTGNYGPNPLSVSREVIGARKHSYHLKLALVEIITPERMKLDLTDYEAMVGGDALRDALNNNQLFTTTAFGFGLLNYDVFRTEKSQCDEMIPCDLYPEAYIVLHNLI